VPETDFVVQEGHVTPPRGPGLGINVSERALEAHTLVKEIVQ
jgi:L-alanine-DL-glutamate epimerase-like enolase superfamily enzyme